MLTTKEIQPMRVALDTTFLDRPPSGIGAYVCALRRELAKMTEELDVVEIRQPSSGPWSRLGSRGARFGWEFVGAGWTNRRSNVDLLHMPMMSRPVMAGCPVVVTVHDVIPYVMPEYRVSRAMQVNIAVAKQSIRFAKAIITPSQHAANDVIRVLGVPRDKVWITYEAADASYAPLRNDQKADRAVLDRHSITGKYIFNVGGLDVRKNVPALVRAFAEICMDGDPDLQLVIAGAEHSSNSVIYPPLTPLIKEFGLERRVILTGRVSEDDKIALMQRAEIYVTPSLYEGFGLTVLEAMACGVPVIAANRTSLPEVVGDAGMLVEPRVPELTSAIRILLASSDLRSKLSAHGRERSSSFSWSTTARETVAVYRRALGKSEEQESNGLAG